MDKDWVRIFSDSVEHKIMLLKLRLGENEIPAIILNKKDSAYNMFGEIELYVRKENAIKAQHLLKDFFQSE